MKNINNFEKAKYAFNYIIENIDAKIEVAHYELGKLAEFGEQQETKHRKKR